jgi:AraC-like DNA-binding protein
MKSPSSREGIRFADWTRLRAHLLWAYHGEPVYPQYRETKLEPRRWTEDSEWLRAYSQAWLLFRGDVKVVSDKGVSLHSRAGEWVFPMRRQTHHFSPGAQIISVAFQAHWPDGTPLYSHDEPISCSAGRFPELASCAWRLVRLALLTQEQPRNHPPQQAFVPVSLRRYTQIARATLSWLSEYDNVMKSLGLQRAFVGNSDPRIAILQQRIDTMPLAEPFDEAAAAKSVGLSVSQMNRIFVNITGTTPREYCQNRRLRFARDTLSNSTMPVKQLAFMLGFRQPSSFSKWFRMRAGLYPRALRRQGGDAELSDPGRNA